jgi:hypothetical protein
MKYNRLFFLIPVIAVVLTSCKKDDPAGINPINSVFNISFSRNALAYVNIPVGKYFIYKTVATGALDSVAVTANQLTVNNYPKNVASNFPEHNIESFRLTLTVYNYINNMYIPIQWLKAAAVNDFYTPYDSSSTADVRLKFSGTDQTIFYASDNLAGVTSLTVEGVNYPEVIRSESTNGLPVTDISYEKNVFYWAKNIGIIKRIITKANGSQTEINLLRHN